MLEEAGVIYRTYKPMIPPQVTYGLTERAQDLIVVLDQLDTIAQRWYAQEQDLRGSLNTVAQRGLE